jgi:hypothetical protein
MEIPMSKAKHALITSERSPQSPRGDFLDPQLFDIRTARELIEALGGVAAVAEEYWTLPSRVKDWAVSGDIPPGWHLQMLGESAFHEKTVAPEAFGFTDEDRPAQGLAKLAAAYRCFLQGGANG